MTSVIQDGTGGGYKAKVGSDNRLAVDAITESIEEKATTEGNGFNVATNRIVLTNSAESALFFIENEEQQDLIITSVFVNTSNSSGTLSGQPILKVYRNPNSGTIIDNAEVITPINSNFGSAKTLSAKVYQGTENDTLTTNQGVIEVPLPSRAAMPLIEFNTTVILPRGARYGITYQPETGSTSVDLIAGITVIKLPEEFA